MTKIIWERVKKRVFTKYLYFLFFDTVWQILPISFLGVEKNFKTNKSVCFLYFISFLIKKTTQKTFKLPVEAQLLPFHCFTSRSWLKKANSKPHPRYFSFPSSMKRAISFSCFFYYDRFVSNHFHSGMSLFELVFHFQINWKQKSDVFLSLLFPVLWYTFETKTRKNMPKNQCLKQLQDSILPSK